MNNTPSYTDSPVHPGTHLKETIDELGITQTILANRIGLSRKVINEIIAGKAPITANTAILLERVLDVPAHYWNNLQKNYELIYALNQQTLMVHREYNKLKMFPVSKMTKHGWLPEAKSKEEKVQNLYSFFGIAKLNNYEKSLAIQFRRSINENYSKESIFAWLRKGELDIQNIATDVFDRAKIVASIRHLRTLTKTQPNIFQSAITEICAKAGIAVAFIPELPKTFINGATFWVNNDKAAILLSLRFKTNDHLWFSFFHELGHIILHRSKKSFVDLDDNVLSSDEEKRETTANEFAANALIHPNQWSAFRSKEPFSKFKVKTFADQINIAPGIVVGRLQKEKLIPYSHLNDLKERFEWVIS
jgi:HTH-type transcriptional regulator / antitoxin HigA